MSKFEINRIIIELIRAILRFRFTSLLPKWQENNIQILFSCHLGAKLVKRNLRIALINSIVMQFISNFDISFYSRVLLKSTRRGV